MVWFPAVLCLPVVGCATSSHNRSPRILRLAAHALRRLALGVGLATLLPGAGAHAQSGSVVVTSDTTWATGSYNLTSLTVQSGATLTIGGGSSVSVAGAVLVTGNSNVVLQSINNGAQVSGAWKGAGVALTAASLQVDAGSSINADGQGYVAHAGPGAGAPGSSQGGSYGGAGGGLAATTVYGSLTAPVDLGSGGGQYQGAGGPGGGALQLTVSGALTNNGVISANGSTVSGFVGGPAGGSVYVVTGTLAGAGVFTANGGSNTSPYGASGGGGRVAVYYNSAQGFAGFAGSTAAAGTIPAGANSPVGSVGTAGFFSTAGGATGLNIFQSFPIPADSTASYSSITVQNGAALTVGGGSTLNVSGTILVTGNSSLVLQTANNSAQVSGAWQGTGVTVNAATVQVDAGSSINADAQGYTVQAGPGAAPAGSVNGGSYGGAGGGQPASSLYGSDTAPVTPGSGGGQYQGTGGAGGGAIRLNVSGTLTDNGVISANGGNVSGFAGGGAGGSVYVTTATLAGNGTFAANGGSNSTAFGDGGGGGRVAVSFSSAPSFTGFASAAAAGGTIPAGSNAAAGGAGTVVFLDTSAQNGNLDIYQNFNIPANTAVTYNQITVRNGAVLTVGGGSTVSVTGAVLVTGSSSIVLQSINNTAQVNGTWQGAGSVLNAASVEVDTGSSINADGQGYVQQAGPGAGTSGTTQGGSYGGLGGGAASSALYGSATAPTALGSGGGAYQAAGGPGGGVVQLAVSGTLLNNGIISANGVSVAGNGFGGGGAGGSVYVTAGNLSGAGIFSATGGQNPTQYGNGGGGGRIAIYYASQANFTGFASSTAAGGSVVAGGGSTAGAVGTEAFFDTSVTNSNVGVYQNFAIPASTSVSYNALNVTQGATLTIGGGSTVNIAQTMHVAGTVTAQSINTSAMLSGSWQGQGVAIKAGALQVDAGASLNADAQGYAVQAGPGAGVAGTGNGGSYGGAGGGEALSTVYGSATAPTGLGSGGGQYQGTAGAGGGAIQITVAGTLTDNGTISANGAPVNGFVGGGAGGSIYVTTATLAGSGIFTANGGSNASQYGDGGGGGRVAIFSGNASGFSGFAGSTASGGTVVAGSGAVAGANGTAAFFDTSAPNGNVSVYQNFAVPANTTVQYNSLTVGAGANVAVGGGSEMLLSGTLHITGTVQVQSTNTAGMVNGTYQGRGAEIIAGNVLIDPAGSLIADGQGYGPQTGPAAGTPGTGNGGGYGGAGGGSTATYGSATNPLDLGSGGGQYQGTAGAGGGAIQLLVSGALTDNGLISANGAGVSGFVGGGSGGSINLAANTIGGTGTITANGGGNSSPYGNGGGGGRIAVSFVSNTGFNQASATANGGTVPVGGDVPGANGTVRFINAPVSAWILPTQPVIHGVAQLEWFTDNGGLTSVALAGPQTSTIATGSGAFSTASFDTTLYPDGAYQLVLSVLNNAGQVVQQVDKDVVINNSVAWHSGTLASSQTWGPPQVQGLDGNVIVPAGVTLTILPGTIVKALPGSQILVLSGGTLIASGTTGSQVTFTTFDDYSIGGNTDFNQGSTLPQPGEWSGIGVLTGGTFTSDSDTVIRYAQTNLSGSISTSTTLFGTQVYVVSGTLTVPNGVTLNIQPGTVLKFTSGAGMDVQPGGTLNANGTLAQPIFFTSINDTSIGGNANGIGGATLPQPGDWNSIVLDGATVSMQHVQMQYGGGPFNASGQAGMVETTDNAVVTITDSVFANSFYIGLQTGYPNGGGDIVTVTDSTFYGIEDRAINAYPGSTVHVVNDTFDGNAAGVMSHGGAVDVENSVITGSISTQFGGIALCCGGTFTALSNNDVYTTAAGVANYTGISDPTGTLGNISANPVYMNLALHDYRPTYGSPLIDAGNGTVANYPLTDSFSSPRYNDPLVTKKTGTADGSGNFPDIGAFEFVQSAPSNLDLTVTNVQGPATALVGSQVQVTWTVTNIGSGTAYGPWHDAVYLVADPKTNPVETLAGMALEGAGVVLGPGASYNATATVTVPGTTVGSQRWEVKTNVLGEVFEGANSGNNTGLALNPVQVDLTQLVAGAGPVNGSFAGTGQTAFYKVVPDASQATAVQLALNTGLAGSVQLFVGAGYVPTPQRFDFQQVEFNSTSASVVIPAGSQQIYYITAYAQSLPVSPSLFSIQASAVQFSLTAVTPGNVVASGSATMTFVGGGFTGGTTFLLVGKDGKTYSSTSTFLADSGHADVTFAVGTIPAGTYAAEATNGSSVTLANAVTLSAAALTTSVPPTVQISLEAPEAFRAGFPSLVTLHYSNVSGDDVPAPILYVGSSNATLSEVPPTCATCSSTYTQQYGATFNSGLVMGIDQQGPAGILPAGASGSIQFLATPLGSGSASFYISQMTADLIGTQLTLAQNLCYETTGIVEVVCFYNQSPVGAYQSAATFCSSLAQGANTAAVERACMVMLNNAGYSYQTFALQGGTLGLQSDWNQFINGHVTQTSFNALLAGDATALSAQGDYVYDMSKLLQYELQKDGLDQFTTRYHQGAFGFGVSHPFDLTLSGNAITYPDGSVRSFTTPSPTAQTVFLGAAGDYGTLSKQTDGSFVLTEPDGHQFHFAAAGSGFQLDSVQDRNGNRVNLTYTGTLVSKITDGFGDSLAFQYDALGHIVQSTDQGGRVATFTYDILSDAQHSTFLTSISDAGGTTHIQWNEGGSNGVGYFDDSCVATYCDAAIGITSITYPDGTQQKYSYDAAGRLIAQSAAGGAQQLIYTYNADGSLTTTDAYGKSQTQTPTPSGYPLAIVDPLGNLSRLRYDGEDKLVGLLGPRGDSFAATYDSSGNPATAISATGTQMNFAWAADQSPVSFTDGNGNTLSFGYDPNFDLLSKSFANGVQETFTYNAQGQPLTRTNRRGNTETYVWGTHGTLTSKTFSNGTTISYTYDSHDNILSVTTPQGVTSYTYDGADRVTSLTNPDGSGITMTYNAGGQRTRMTDSTGFITNYAYDAVGRVSQLTDGSGNLIVSYTYDANGRLAGKALANGTSATASYDPLGRPLSVINYSPSKAVLSEYDYTYDAEGNPLTMKAPNGTSTFAYDLNGQLTSVTAPTASVQYTFDAAGNRTQVTTNGTVASYEPNNLNEYQAVNGVPYVYDADGNLTSGNGWTYTYDDENHLLSMTSSSDNWSFQYDGLGNRVLGTHNGVTTRYLIDPQGFGNLVAELNSSGAATAHYVYGLDLTSTVQAGSTSYYAFDGTGNTVQLTDSTGKVVNSYSYLPFGEKTVVSATVANPFTFAGEVGIRDEGSGLYFMRNRWYNPALGRFQQPDPMGLAGSPNFYTYVQNSPLTALDPLGLVDPDYTAFTIGLGLQTGVAVNNHNGDTFISVGVATGGGVSVVEGYVSLKQPADRGQAVSDVMGGASFNAGAYEGGGAGITVTPSGDVSFEKGYGGGGKGGSLNYAVKVPNDLAETHRVFDDVNMFTGGKLYGNDPSNPLTDPAHPIFPHLLPQPCGSCITHKTPLIIVPVNGAIDPNGKLTSGFGDSGYVPAGAPIEYTIYFENQPTATLPAQKVVVTDKLAANLDWSTVQFSQVSFNNVTLSVPPGSQSFATRTHVSTDSNPVAVSAALNPATGILTWTMQSVDPVTGSTPANPLTGFLPPNNSANAGVGSVTFTVVPKQGLANATTISNQGSIVFDANAAIATNTVTNVLDISSPTSAINPLPASTTASAINVGWSGSDPSGSGIASYNIYVAIDGGAYSLWLSATTLSSSTYNALPGHSYAFTSLATNNVGIVQSTPAAPQVIVVSLLTPVVTVTPAASNVSGTQPLGVTVTIGSPVSGTSVPTGTMTLSSGAYTSAAATLNNGSATFTIPAGILAPGVDTLTATYIPDGAAALIFNGATGVAQVTVGAVAPIATLSVSSLTFSATAGTTSAAQAVQLTNTGNATLTISGISLAGAGAGSFSQTNTCGATLAAGASCSVSVVFTPATATTFNASLSIADNATGSPQTVALSGTGTAVQAPVASITPTSLSFTSPAGVTTTAQTVKLSNTGNSPMTLTGISQTVTGTGSFVETNTCGSTLAAGASCTLSILFTPISATTTTASLLIADNASGSPQTVTLSGTGTAAQAPAVSLTPTSLAFTSVAGTGSGAQTATLKNTGSAALTISGISLAGTGAGSFAQTNTCGANLAAGASCSISLVFTPSAAGTYAASLTVADNASGSPHTITLSGTGTPAPAPVASLSPASLSFTATAGNTSSPQTAQFSNTGNAPLAITGISLSGSGAGSFAQTNTCGASLAAGASCTLSITFSPATASVSSAIVNIADNASGSPQTLTLSGTGTAAPTFQLSASPASQSVVPGSSASYTIVVAPQGGAFTNAVNLSVSGLPPASSASFSPASLTPGSANTSSTLTVQTGTNLASSRHENFFSARPLLALCGVLFVATRKRRRLALLCVLLLASLAGSSLLTGCATSNHTATYTLTVTGTSGTQVQTTTVSLILHE